jgi:hypothetical protein
MFQIRKLLSFLSMVWSTAIVKPPPSKMRPPKTSL